MSTPRAPEGTGAAGRRLWRAVTAEFALEEHELTLLIQAVHVADTCAELRAIVDREGLVTGKKVHPAAVELRQQQILLARLIVALRVPIGDQEVASKTGAPRLQRRGIRGPYGGIVRALPLGRMA